MKSDLSGARIPTIKFILIFLSLTIVSIAWFSPFSYHAIMGDDLNGIISSQNGGFASSFLKAFLQAPYNKYRPLTDIAFRAETLIFGNDLRHYIYLNIFIEIVNSSLLSFICWKLSRRKASVAFLAGILFIVSRFSYYNILQIFGGCLEGLALFFILLLVCMVVFAYETKKARYLLLAVLSYFCAIFTHERYMVTAVFLFFSTIWAPVDYKRWYFKYYLACTPFLILFLNFAIKTFWLKSRFLEGGGGTAISFVPSQFLIFFAKGLLNLCGFNAGPEYLSGLDVLKTGFWGITLGSIFCVCLIAMIWFYQFKNVNRDQDKDIMTKNILFLLCTLLIPLMAAASITIRQEYRWLYAPYAVFIIAICYILGRIRPRRVRIVFICLILFSAASIELFYRQFHDNIYFFAALKTAQSAKNLIVDENIVKYPHKKIFFLGAKDAVRKWIFQNDDFFKYYSNNPNIHINYVSDVRDIPYRNNDMNEAVVYALNQNREVVDVTEEVRNYFDNPMIFVK